MSRPSIIKVGTITIQTIEVKEETIQLGQLYEWTEYDCIELVTCDNNIGIIVDEEGLLKPGNIVNDYHIVGDDGIGVVRRFAGQAVIVGLAEEEMVPLTEKQLKYIEKYYHIQFVTGVVMEPMNITDIGKEA